MTSSPPLSPALPRPVLLLHSSGLVGGGNMVLLRLLDALDRARFAPRSILATAGPLGEALDRRRVPWQHVPLRATAGVSRLRTLAQLGLLVAQCRGGLVHVNDPITYGLTRRAGVAASPAWICHVHHPDVDAATLQWAFRVPPDLVLTPSRHVAGLVRTLCTGLDPTRVMVIGNPVDTDVFHPPADRAQLRDRLGLAPDVWHLVTAGALSPHKGQDLFVDVVARLREAGDAVHGHVVGGVRPGNEAFATAVRLRVQAQGLSSAVTFHDFVSDGQLRDLLQAADLFLLPTAEEGFGLVLAEAQACGVPPLATAIAPLDEVVLDGRTGVLTARTPEALAGAAHTLLRDTALRQRMGREGLEWVTRSFGVAPFAARVRACYERVLSD